MKAISDGLVVAKRNLIRIKRVPDLLVFTTMQPIMFVLLFAYIFGSSIKVEGLNYREFLIAGVFTQTLVFGASITGVGLAEDIQKGIIDRFRSLPMAPSAVLIGRTASDVVSSAIVMVVMSLTGLVVGWRVRTSILDALAGFLLLLLFSYAISWVMAFVGLRVKTPEVVNNAAFMAIFPLTFIANTFVPSENLPTALRVFSDYNPVSSVTLAGRQLFGNIDPNAKLGSAFGMQHPVLYSLIWIGILLVVFVPLSIRQYKLSTSR